MHFTLSDMKLTAWNVRNRYAQTATVYAYDCEGAKLKGALALGCTARDVVAVRA